MTEEPEEGSKPLLESTIKFQANETGDMLPPNDETYDQLKITNTDLGHVLKFYCEGLTLKINQKIDSYFGKNIPMDHYCSGRGYDQIFDERELKSIDKKIRKINYIIQEMRSKADWVKNRK